MHSFVGLMCCVRVTCRCQIMLWEKKIQLVKETRSALESEVVHGEIQRMKAEIHQMDVNTAHTINNQRGRQYMQHFIHDMCARVNVCLISFNTCVLGPTHPTTEAAGEVGEGE